MQSSLLLACLASALALTTGQDLTMFAGLLLTVFTQFSTQVAGMRICGTLLLKFVRAPGSHRVVDGWCASLLFLVKSDLVPVQGQSVELPATTVGEWRRRDSVRRQGRTSDYLATSFHRAPLQGGFEKLVRHIPKKPGREPARVMDCARSVATSRSQVQTPSGVIQPGSWRNGQGPTGSVWAKTLVDVPAASW